MVIQTLFLFHRHHLPRLPWWLLPGFESVSNARLPLAYLVWIIKRNVLVCLNNRHASYLPSSHFHIKGYRCHDQCRKLFKKLESNPIKLPRFRLPLFAVAAAPRYAKISFETMTVSFQLSPGTILLNNNNPLWQCWNDDWLFLPAIQKLQTYLSVKLQFESLPKLNSLQ